MGLPFALTLFRPDLDKWEPGEHNGTFPGNCHAFVTATAAIRHFGKTDDFANDVKRRAELLGRRLKAMAATDPDRMSVKGRGMMQGIDVGSGELASVITSAAFEKGLIIETSGPHDEVVKVLAPLTIDDDVFSAGLDIVERSEEHTSELQSLMRISYAVFCL